MHMWTEPSDITERWSQKSHGITAPFCAHGCVHRSDPERMDAGHVPAFPTAVGEVWLIHVLGWARLYVVLQSYIQMFSCGLFFSSLFKLPPTSCSASHSTHQSVWSLNLPFKSKMSACVWMHWMCSVCVYAFAKSIDLNLCRVTQNKVKAPCYWMKSYWVTKRHQLPCKQVCGGYPPFTVKLYLGHCLSPEGVSNALYFWHFRFSAVVGCCCCLSL